MAEQVSLALLEITSVSVGAWLGLVDQFLYLHAGTRRYSFQFYPGTVGRVVNVLRACGCPVVSR